MQEETKAFLSCARHIHFAPKLDAGVKGSVDFPTSNATKEGDRMGGNVIHEDQIVEAVEGEEQPTLKAFGNEESIAHQLDSSHVTAVNVFSFSASSVKMAAYSSIVRLKLLVAGIF